MSLRHALAEDPTALIETEIGKLYQEAARDPERARHLLALRFYLADVIAEVTGAWFEMLNGFTHYADLLQRLGRWRARTGGSIALVTFNYDELLDRSLEAQAGNLAFTTIASYTARVDWRLYKLHGSTGWSRVVKATGLEGLRGNANDLIAQAEKLDLSTGEIRPQPWTNALQPGEPAIAVPGIAVPTDLKQTFECPPEHVEEFTAEIEQIDRVIIIGWRGSEPHVRELLSEHIQPGFDLAVCDVSDAAVQAVRTNLGQVGARARTDDPTDFVGGFTGMLEADRLERWLERPSFSDARDRPLA